MSEKKTSAMSEETLWSLYQRLLAADLFAQHTPGSQRARAGHSAMAAALAENLRPGDTLGLAAGDQATRYLCGVPLGELSQPGPGLRRAKPSLPAWAQPCDARHALLPGTAAQQAALALGTALAARLHQTGAITVLFDSRHFTARKAAAMEPQWESAAETAAALGLPLVLITGPRGSVDPGPRQAPAPLPVIPVDRADTLAIYRVIYESTGRARTSGGPTWIECQAWSGPKQATAAGADWPRDLDPLPRMEQALRARKLYEERRHRQLLHTTEKEFAAAGWTPREFRD